MQIEVARISKEVRYDQLTPVSVYAAIGGVGACMMESAYDEGYGTYSFIGVNPIATFKASGNTVTMFLKEETQTSQQDPYEALANFAKGHRVFGCISYDSVRLKESLPDRHPRSQKIPDFLFHIYQTVLRFDHKAQKIEFTHFGSESELEQLIQKAFTPVAISHFQEPVSCELIPDMSDAEFIDKVKLAQEYIKTGDIFQVVLSRTFCGHTQVKPFDLYRALRQLSPTPYLTFIEEAEFSIASASPELLVGVRSGLIESVPIAGTCKKDDDIQKLLDDPKENAEHVMLVDLARNDVGSVALPGTVQVSEYKAVRHYSHVSHLVSRVIGSLDSRYTPLEVLKASLPAGTLSGAPKIRAMQIIDELELSRRGLYGGALLTIDEAGNLTSAIAIRTAYVSEGNIEVRAGAGIVLDSVPEKEAEETMLKARGILSALELATGVKGEL